MKAFSIHFAVAVQLLVMLVVHAAPIPLPQFTPRSFNGESEIGIPSLAPRGTPEAYAFPKNVGGIETPSYDNVEGFEGAISKARADMEDSKKNKGKTFITTGTRIHENTRFVDSFYLVLAVERLYIDWKVAHKQDVATDVSQFKLDYAAAMDEINGLQNGVYPYAQGQAKSSLVYGKDWQGLVDHTGELVNTMNGMNLHIDG